MSHEGHLAGEIIHGQEPGTSNLKPDLRPTRAGFHEQ
jgi:hypothetical protein